MGIWYIFKHAHVGCSGIMKIKLEKRKIRAMNYNRMITLPKVWLRSTGLEVGDYVSFEIMEDGALVLRPLKGGEGNG